MSMAMQGIASNVRVHRRAVEQIPRQSRPGNSMCSLAYPVLVPLLGITDRTME
jgi:hypothetical protein